MSDDLIFESGFANGRWTGSLRRETAQPNAPEIGVFLDGRDLGDVAASAEEDGLWKLEFPVPTEALGEGVSTFVFVDRQSSEPVGRFCVIAGAVADRDVLAQLDALQSELDLLKSAFRREARRNRDVS